MRIHPAGGGRELEGLCNVVQTNLLSGRELLMKFQQKQFVISVPYSRMVNSYRTIILGKIKVEGKGQ